MRGLNIVLIVTEKRKWKAGIGNYGMNPIYPTGRDLAGVL
jgi:hypothetical protein